MTQLRKVKVAWTGFPGAPGYSNFYCISDDVPSFSGALRTFFASLSAGFPTDVSIQVPNSGDMIDVATGALVGDWTEPANAIVTGTSGSTYAAPAGAQVRWKTSAFGPHRRIIGKTFLVPYAGSAFTTAGNLGASSVSLINASAATLIGTSGLHMQVWSRPRPKAAANGTTHAVTGGTADPNVVVLRSRRD